MNLRNPNITIRCIFFDYAKKRLEEFRLYTRDIENKFSSDSVDVMKNYEEQIDRVPEEMRDEIARYFEYDHYLIGNVFSVTFRNSVLIAIYSFLEAQMSGICNLIHERGNSPLSAKDLRGDGIERSKLFLTKLAGVNFDEINSEWSKIKTLNKVRNCLVHCEGDIERYKGNNSLIKSVGNTRGLRITSDGHISVEREYVDSTIDVIESFLDMLYQRALP